ncbi:hypothetical protein ACN38_g8553 [Penicillium nordicum]|uniref:Chromo domain-containing protein n=1 Tax=Penicillium nordicum TaxID=229535 RepID=A0A0M8NZS3_9EURO|nr:hypothetical protein ACN38_g8553 [Penicillium nordicum]
MIEKTLDSRVTKNRHGKRRLEYYVKWKGYPPSWRPQQDLVPGSGELFIRNGWRYDLRGTHMVYMSSPEREEATFLLLPRATSCI